MSRAPLPEPIAAAARAAYEKLSRNYGDSETDVAVRSCATAEDLPTASCAGQQETFLNVREWEELDRDLEQEPCDPRAAASVVVRDDQGTCAARRIRAPVNRSVEQVRVFRRR